VNVTKPKILFVDDEPDVLQGLARILHKQSARWETVFVLGARPGLEKIQGTTFDVVVSDMRMPDFDGVEVLRHVRDRDPTTIRMVLSGYHEIRPVSHVAPVVHQFLDKPCPSERLIQTIERACAIRARCVNEPLQALVGRIAALAPGVIDAAIAQVIAQNSALSARILVLARVASSPVDTPITSIPDVVSRLGLDFVASYAFATASKVTGASLIRDISKAVIAIAMPEEELVGTNHTELGAYLLTRWGLPLETIEALAQPDKDTSPALLVCEAG
jgi:DNA-binding NarL/FixJ family response regulator